MTSPPKRKPLPVSEAEQGGMKTNFATRTVKHPGPDSKPELWPANVSRLSAAGVVFTWNRPDHILIVTCPACGGRLLIDAEQPYWGCMGNLICKINRMPFAAVIAALVEGRTP